MSTHAILGASGAYRWMNCAGSVAASAGLIPSGSSVYALEGNAAHALAEACLRYHKIPRDAIGGVVQLDRDGDLVSIEWPNPGATPTQYPQVAHTFRIDDDMVEAVEVFVDDVRADYAELAGAGTGMEVEAKFNLERLTGRKDMFGTADAVIVQPYGDLVVNDYKHGKGIVVEVEENEQAMFYALGAMCKFGTDFARVRIKITQPRAPHRDGAVREWITTPAELLEWSEMLILAAEATEKPNAPLNAGSWCRFCPAKMGITTGGKAVSCPELKDRIQTALKVRWDNAADPVPPEGAILPAADDHEQISRALNILPVLDSWIKDVQGLAQRALEHGHKVPGYKLVRKRANRRWVDPDALERKLKNKAGVKKADTHVSKLKTPAQLEKAPGLDREWIDKHTETPEGGLTVVPDGDRREAVTRAPLKYSELPADTAPKKESP